VIERRRLRRTKVSQPAKALAGEALHDCTVEDLNTSGACISLHGVNPNDLPLKFGLSFDNCHTFWDCDLIWRDHSDGRVGVTWKPA
jgi:hypothetical protein